MIRYMNLEEFIGSGEDVAKEFKPNFRNHRRDIAQCLTAFANDLNWVGGGYIFIGVEDDGRARGINEDYDEIQKGVADICRTQISPPLAPIMKRAEYQGKIIVEVKVSRSVNRPHRLNQTCHVRIGSTTRNATREEEDLIRQCSIVPSFDGQPLAKATHNDIDWNLFREYLLTTRSPDIFETDSDIINIAKNLEFVIEVDDQIIPKVGAILLFGKNPIKFFPSCKIQAVRFKGLDLSAPTASTQSFEGTLPYIIRSAQTFLETISSKASVFPSGTSNRVDYVEYPFLAMREAVANAVFHRDYSIEGREIDVRVFDDRIEIMSPGGLGGGLTIEDLGTGKRFIRNLFIADKLRDMRFVERAGLGIYRMRKEMEANGSPSPIFQSDQNTFLAILSSHPFYSSQRLLEEANQAKANASYDVARNFYIKSLDLYPSNYSALHSLADMELQIGNREKCRDYLRQAIDLQNSNPQAWLTWAILEEKFSSYDSARSIYISASKNVTKSSMIFRNWAIMEWRQKNYNKADSLFEKAIQKDPKDYMNWYKKGQMNINSPIEKIMREGEKSLKKASTVTDDSYVLSDIYFLLARAMQKLRYSHFEINENYKKSIDLNPGRGTVHHYYGMFLKEMGKQKEAKFHLDRAKRFGYIPKHKRIKKRERS